MDYIWNITGHCNLRCDYCWDIFKEERDINTIAAKQIINKIVINNCDMLLFTGGEPLVRKDLFELIHYANHTGAKNIKICTNGTLISERLEELVNAPIAEIHISLDSVLEEVEGYRGIRNREVMHNIELLIQEAKCKMKIVLVSVLDCNHLEQFEDILCYAKKNNIQVSYQLPVIAENKDLDLNINKLNRTELSILFEQLDGYHKKYKETIDYFANFYFLTAKKYYLQGIIPNICGAGKEFQIISPKGELYSCYSCKSRKKEIAECFEPKCLIWFRSGKKARNILKLVNYKRT